MKSKFYALFLLVVFSHQGQAAPIQFEDTSDELGFTRGTETWGLSWGNLNLDKYPDLWNSAHRDFPRLYQNDGAGGFDDVAMYYDKSMNGHWLSNTFRDMHGGGWADFDNDGDDDIVVGDEEDLYTNRASSGGLFSQSNINTPQQWAGWKNTDGDRQLEVDLSCAGSKGGQYALLFDLDNNGDLESICGAELDFPYNVVGASSSLVPSINLVNDAAIGDFNNDLRTDIIVTRGSTRPTGASKTGNNTIEAWFRPGATPQFTFSAQGQVEFLIDGDTGGPYLEATRLNLNSNGQNFGNARGVHVDYVGGQWRVRYLSNDQAYVRIKAQNTVSQTTVSRLTNADLPQASAHGINSASGINWVFNTGLRTPVNCGSVVAADFDNDMDLDLYMTCRTGVENLKNRYYDNQGNGTFVEVTSHGGEGPVGAGIEFGVADSVVTADYDLDGFMDLAVSNGALFYPVSLGGPDTLIRNKGNTNHWVELDLIGTISPRAAIGAKVYLTAGGVTQLREQSGGYHRWSQNHTRIHFGLAGNTNIDEIRVEWPSGRVNRYNNIAADSLYDVVENGSITRATLTPDPVTFSSGEECDKPPYTPTLGPVLQLWRSCGTDNWRLRVVGGVSRLTQNKDLTAEGTILGSSGRLRSVKGISTTSIDQVDISTPSEIDFRLIIQPDQANQKGINFNAAGQTSACLFFDNGSTDFNVIYFGNTGKRIQLPFDFINMQSCDIDSDGDGLNDAVDPDDDNDGVLDVNDDFPLDPTESKDTDGDGVGDNADAFPNDPNETTDSDGDGVGDNSDIDKDNDGLTDATETFSAQTTTQTIDNFESNLGWNTNPNSTDTATTGQWQVGNPQGTSSNGSSMQLNATTSGSNALVTGLSAGSSVGSFDIDNGVTSVLSPSINLPQGTKNLRFNYYFAHLSNASSADFFRVYIVAGSNQQSVLTQTGNNSVRVANWTAFNVDISAFAGQSIRLLVEAADGGSPSLVEAAMDDISITITSSGSNDQDRDGVINLADLDSDNDTIADVVEAGLLDVNGDFIVDDLINSQGTVTSPLDSDNDGIPDYLDLESNNPANDGTAFDIARTANAGLDTNADGKLSDADNNGGVDVDRDGIDDLIDTNPNGPGSGAPLAADVICNQPNFDRSTERAVFVWKDCNSGKVFFRLTGGGVSNSATASGQVFSSAGFSGVKMLSIESSDTFDTASAANLIDYSLRVSGAWFDGFNFTPNSSNGCIVINANVPIYLGQGKTQASSPFNLDTLAACTIQ